MTPIDLDDRVRFVLLPTDYSEASVPAFAHALRLVVTNKGALTLLHVVENQDEGDDGFPSVRAMLQRWGLLEAGAKRTEVFQELGVEVRKVVYKEGSIAGSIADYIDTHQVDLMVVATEQRGGLTRWLHPSTAERIARRTTVPTLFVPTAGRGCVSPDDGKVTLNHVLIPIDHDPPAGEAVERGLRALAAYGQVDRTLTLLHVGSGDRFPSVQIPSGSCAVERITRDGHPVTEILAAAQQTAADLLIMVTKGTEGVLDALRGTTTEQVLRQAPCPVLMVPADE